MSRRGSNEATFSLFAFQDIVTALTGIIILITLLLCVALAARSSEPQTETPVGGESTPVATESLADLEAEVARLRQELQDIESLNQQLSGNSAFDLQAEANLQSGRRDRLEGDVARLRKQLEAALRAQADWNQQLQRRAGDLRDADRLRKELAVVSERLESLRSSKRAVYNFRDAEAREIWLVDIGPTKIQVARQGVKRPPQVMAAASERARREAFMRWTANLTPTRTHLLLLLRPGAIAIYNELRKQLTRKGFALGIELLDATTVVIDKKTGAAL